jgi:antitoxin (DNA-binding transcriptional repressor) of toxin-antitoxin stability system
METSYGIEAARAKLGDIAEHVRTTGETVDLTRHGRTVAVIGPANSVPPAPPRGTDATLYFPDGDSWHGCLPGVPHEGNTLTREVGHRAERWSVASVEWYVRDEGPAILHVYLAPTTEK